MSHHAPNDPRSFGTAAEARIEAGLRQHMQRVYGYMAAGLMLTGLVAYAAAVFRLLSGDRRNTPALDRHAGAARLCARSELRD